MASYDSDESTSDEELGTSTNVLLGYASKDPTEDTISHLGGVPTWLDPTMPPSHAYSRCQNCSKPMALLLELNADLPERFLGHERRLYVWACRKKQCRRKPGSIRALRSVRASGEAIKALSTNDSDVDPAKETASVSKPDLGAKLFGAGDALGGGGNPLSSPASGNPFSTGGPQASSTGANPFSTTPQSPKAETQTQTPGLAATFAQKARITDHSTDNLPHPPLRQTQQSPEFEAWPSHPEADPHPHLHLDADYEYLTQEPTTDPSAAQTAFLDTADPTSSDDAPGAGASALPDDRIDRTFQHFADTLAQNPEQALRYDFGGRPLLYRRDDAVGRALAPGGAGMPPCGACGARRVLEVQLAPGAIAALEEDVEAARVLAEGMEWGTVIVGVCGADCADEGVSAREEWVGVQWEEVVDRKAAAAAAAAGGASKAPGGKDKGKSKK